MTTTAFSLRFSAHGATLDWPDGPLLRGVTAAVRYRAGGEPRTLHLARPGHAASADGLEAAWCWELDDRSCGIWLEIANTGSDEVPLDGFDVLAVHSDQGGVCDLGTPVAEWSFYQNGWQSWTPTFARRADDGYTDPATPDYRRMHQPHWDPARSDDLGSEWVTVIKPQTPNSKSQALLLGFVTTKDQLSEIRMAPDGANLIARCHLDGAILHPGEEVRSERLWLLAGRDPVTLLEAWADRTGREMEARVSADPPTGWCTWYYFYGENTAQDVLANVAAAADFDLPLDTVLLDDGYQTAIGDWLSLDEKKFPDGMEPVTKEIRRAGHRVGIWTAPFGAAVDSRLLSQHPDWCLRDEEGEPVIGWTHWGKTCYALDCTHPEVLDWLRETFGHMRTAWGVELFKIDFLFAAARSGQRHDPTATRAQALRRGLKAIREAIDDDAFLLGCGAPLGPCVGLVDGMRIGPDVDPNWHPLWRHDMSMPSTENALRNAVARAPLHGRLWANDPDCLLVRQRGEDMDLVLNEMRTLAALVALLGGLTLNSDHLPVIRPGRLKYLRQTLPPTGISARPLDLFEHEMPRLLLLPVERDWGCWWVAGVVNWDDHTTETTVRLDDLDLPAGRYHVYHYWRRRYLGVTDDDVTIGRHQPHETAVLLFKPVSDRPDLLTTTFHVCQGAVEVASCKSASLQVAGSSEGVALSVALRKAGRQFGRVLFTVPQGWRVVEAEVDGRKQAPVAEAPGVISFGLTLEDRAVVEVGFEKVAP